MAVITSANLAQAIVKLVAAEAVPALMGNLVMGNLVNRNFEAVLQNAGDTVNVPIPPTLVANNIAETGSVQTQAASLGNAQVVLNTHAEASFGVPDVTQLFAQPNLLKTLLQPAMIAIAEKIETDLLSLYSLMTFNSAVGTGNTPLTEATLDLAETQLFAAKVPAALQRNLILSATAYSQVRQLPRFSEAQTVGSGAPIQNGVLGTIKNFNVYRSQFVPKPSTTTYNQAFVRDGIALAVRRLPQPLPGTGAIAEYAELGGFGLRIVMSYVPGTLSQQFTVDVLYGTAILRNQFCQQVLS